MLAALAPSKETVNPTKIAKEQSSTAEFRPIFQHIADRTTFLGKLEVSGMSTLVANA